MSRRKRTGQSLSNTPGLRLVGEDESGSVSTPYGPLRAGLITTPAINKEVALTESLNSLESEVATLESRYYAVLDTFLNVMTDLVRLGAFTNRGDTTEK